MSKTLHPLKRALKNRFRNIPNALRFFGLRSGGVWWTWNDLARVVRSDVNLQEKLGAKFGNYFYSSKNAA